MFSGKLVLIYIFCLFFVLYFLIGQLKEEHNSRLCNVHIYI